MKVRRSVNRGRRRDGGFVLVFLALALPALLGVAALALEGGVLMSRHRQNQAVADAAAHAAACDLAANPPSSMGADPSGSARTAALRSAASNGYFDASLYPDQANATVEVNIPPTSGPFAGKAGNAEAIVSFQQQRYFSGIFSTLSNQQSSNAPISVKARAVGQGVWKSFPAAILLLSPNDEGALRMTGSGLISTEGVGIIVNSNDDRAVVMTGSGDITTAKLVIAGSPGFRITGSAQIHGTIQSGASPTADPLQSLEAPNYASMTTQSSSRYRITGSSSRTINPGVYVGGISMTGSGSLTMNPGIYYMKGGGFSMTGSGSLTGNGVMIYNDPDSNNDSISMTGSGGMTLSAPTSGLYQGISIFQKRTATAQVKLTGSGSMNVTGTVYAAGAEVDVAGSGSSNVYGSQYIAYTLNVTGSGEINITAAPNLTARVRSLTLVE